MTASPSARLPVDAPGLEALQRAVGVLSAKWSLAVLAALAAGTLRFNELLGRVDGVSRRMLSTTLRGLEREGLVLRKVHARVPVRVDYELSEPGERLLSALVPLAGWGEEHRAAQVAARARFDRLQARRKDGEALRAEQKARGPHLFY